MNNFILFDNTHLITIGVGFFLSILFLVLAFFARRDTIAKFMAIIVLAIKCLELVYRHHLLGENIAELLPFHLCNLTLIFALIMMLTTSKTFFQPLYFWGIGAIFAIALPELDKGITDFASISFFITHFFILFSIVYGLLHFKFRVTKLGAFTSFILLNLIAIALFYLNKKLGTNYLYVNRPPLSVNLADFFGPWPYYIFSVEGIYIAISFILYLPFREKKMKYHHF